MKRVLPWIGFVLACASTALVARPRWVNRTRLVVVPNQGESAQGLPILALPSADHSYRDLGAFRLVCESSECYWPYDVCKVDVADNAGDPLDLGMQPYGSVAKYLALRRARDGAYVLSDSPVIGAGEHIYGSFLAEPTVVRLAHGLLALPIVALLSAFAALMMRRRARTRAKELAESGEGTVCAGDTVAPSDGGAPRPLATKGLTLGATVLYSPALGAEDYRSAPRPVEAREGSRAALARAGAVAETRIRALVALSIAASLAALGSELVRH